MFSNKAAAFCVDALLSGSPKKQTNQTASDVNFSKEGNISPEKNGFSHWNFQRENGGKIQNNSSTSHINTREVLIKNSLEQVDHISRSSRWTDFASFHFNDASVGQENESLLHLTQVAPCDQIEHTNNKGVHLSYVTYDDNVRLNDVNKQFKIDTNNYGVLPANTPPKPWNQKRHKSCHAVALSKDCPQVSPAKFEGLPTLLRSTTPQPVHGSDLWWKKIPKMQCKTLDSSIELLRKEHRSKLNSGLQDADPSVRSVSIVDNTSAATRSHEIKDSHVEGRSYGNGTQNEYGSHILPNVINDCSGPPTSAGITSHRSSLNTLCQTQHTLDSLHVSTESKCVGTTPHNTVLNKTLLKSDSSFPVTKGEMDSINVAVQHNSPRNGSILCEQLMRTKINLSNPLLNYSKESEATLRASRQPEDQQKRQMRSTGFPSPGLGPDNSTPSSRHRSFNTWLPGNQEETVIHATEYDLHFQKQSDKLQMNNYDFQRISECGSKTESGQLFQHIKYDLSRSRKSNTNKKSPQNHGYHENNINSNTETSSNLNSFNTLDETDLALNQEGIGHTKSIINNERERENRNLVRNCYSRKIDIDDPPGHQIFEFPPNIYDVRVEATSSEVHSSVTGIQSMNELDGSDSKLHEHGDIRVELLQKNLWQKFYRHGTEMIITKIGRRMFPVVRIRIRGLVPDRVYLVYLDMHPVDSKRYRYVYQSSRWLVAGAGERHSDSPPSSGESPVHHTDGTNPCTSKSGVYLHPDSPATGEHWNSTHMVTFDKLKLTNNKQGAVRGQICLHSMQKYQPRIWIQEVPSINNPHGTHGMPQAATDSVQPCAKQTLTTEQRIGKFRRKSSTSHDECSQGKSDRSIMTETDHSELYCGSEFSKNPVNDANYQEEFTKEKLSERNIVLNMPAEFLCSLVDRSRSILTVFPETCFITVTAYQNQQITKLKINSNPFAKGFRDVIKQKENLEHRPPSTLIVPHTLPHPLQPDPLYCSHLNPLTSSIFPSPYHASPPYSPLSVGLPQCLIPQMWLLNGVHDEAVLKNFMDNAEKSDKLLHQNLAYGFPLESANAANFTLDQIRTPPAMPYLLPPSHQCVENFQHSLSAPSISSTSRRTEVDASQTGASMDYSMHPFSHGSVTAVNSISVSSVACDKFMQGRGAGVSHLTRAKSLGLHRTHDRANAELPPNSNQHDVAAVFKCEFTHESSLKKNNYQHSDYVCDHFIQNKITDNSLNSNASNNQEMCDTDTVETALDLTYGAVIA